MAKMAILELLDSPKLISHKILTIFLPAIVRPSLVFVGLILTRMVNSCVRVAAMSKDYHPIYSFLFKELGS